jgi:hypothetical protein
MTTRLSPTELGRAVGMGRREVIERCMDWGVPIFGGRIDASMFMACLANEAATWALMDSTGNLIDSFADRNKALQAYTAILEADPENLDHVALIGYDEAGNPVSAPPGRASHRV